MVAVSVSRFRVSLLIVYDVGLVQIGFFALFADGLKPGCSGVVAVSGVFALPPASRGRTRSFLNCEKRNVKSSLKWKHALMSFDLNPTTQDLFHTADLEQ